MATKTKKKSMLGRSICALIIAALVSILLYSFAHAQTKRIAASYSAINTTQTGFYLTKNAKIFEKHELYVDPVYVADGSRIAQTIITGEFTLALTDSNIVNVNLAD